jgi:hypothetical protein
LGGRQWHLRKPERQLPFDRLRRPDEATEEITMAQVTAARMLTEMLRWRYPMPGGEYFSEHAQVSDESGQYALAAHTDWARDFPFAALGLPDNYAVPPASLYAFGFSYDDTFLRISSGRLEGLALAEDRLARQAEQAGSTRPAQVHAAASFIRTLRLL